MFWFRVPPCGWSKSGDFEDYEVEFLDGGANSMLANLWVRVPNHMSPDTLYRVNNILMSNWGLTVEQMPRMKQQQCESF
ncbi:hypothetical protein ACF0H5_016966 [Mactra antiquata]